MAVTRTEWNGSVDFWKAYESNRESLEERLLAIAGEHPEFGPVLKGMDPEQRAQTNRRSRELQRRALLDDDWDPYLADLRAQGDHYAQAGISFPAWFELISVFRRLMTPHLFSAYGHAPERFQHAADAMNDLIDKALAVIGQAYLEAKERLIARHQEAFKELSTPVLQARDGLLILPLIGILDTERARQLTEQLLHAIRANRARAVVIDITGVPAVDTKVANHLAQTVEAARLMGATAVISGLSAEVAQALVTLGIDLGKVRTVADLQSGIDEANRALGYKVVKVDPAIAGS